MDNRRLETRYPVNVAGDVHDGMSAALDVRIADLSKGGCRFSASRAVQAGAYVTLALGSAGYYDAQVVWSDGSHHGAAFEHPLHPAVLDHLRYFDSRKPAAEA